MLQSSYELDAKTAPAYSVLVHWMQHKHDMCSKMITLFHLATGVLNGNFTG